MDDEIESTGDCISVSKDKTSAATPDDNLNFADFSKAFDEVREARKALEKYGTARLTNPPPPEIVAAQKAFVGAATRYNAIVAALIKPAF